MPHPSFLTIGTVNCLETSGLVGADDLVGVLGADRLPIGRYNAGTTSDAGISRAIAPGIEQLVILVTGLTSDDELIRVDLRQDMDQDRVVGIFADRARYDISLRVQSEPDG